MDADMNSVAASKGIDAGDVIVDVNQKPATSIKVLTDAVEQAKSQGRDSVLLLINRQGRIQFVAVKIETPDQNDKE